MTDDSPVAALARGETVDVQTAGSSMAPVIRDGERVRVMPLGGAALHVGDVVLAVVGGRWVLHRVVRIDARGVHLRGDNARAADPPVRRGAVLGRAVWVWRSGRSRGLAWPRAAASVWVRVAPWLARLNALRARAAQRG